MKRYFLFFFIVLYSISFSQHQFLKIPKLEDEDVKSKAPADGSEIPAEFLHKSVYYLINTDGFIEKKYKERIKIYNKDLSEKFLNKEIFVRDGNPRQTLSGLKAFTYNYENGKVESTKIDKESQYKSNEDKEVNVTKFAFPNVKNGSVIEYEYTITSPPDFLMMIPTFVVEEDVPIRYAEYVLDCPSVLAYNLNYSGELVPTHRDYGPKNIYGSSYYVYRFAYKNVPAFKSEKFVLNSENQKTSIRCELNSTNFNNNYKSYAMNWQDIKKGF